jgi:hypothetical protein
MLSDIQVELSTSVMDQLILVPSVLTRAQFENFECKATVLVAAKDDRWEEGDHYSTILHTVTNLTSGGSIILSDGSPLLSANILVTIYDDDTAGVIIEETDIVTAVAELDAEGKAEIGDPTYYEDEYFVRLTKEPEGEVEIEVDSFAVATDRESIFTPPGRNFTKRKQVYVNGLESIVLKFNETNWFVKQEVRVTAIDDDIEEGVDYLNFAKRPSNLVSSSVFTDICTKLYG